MKSKKIEVFLIMMEDLFPLLFSYVKDSKDISELKENLAKIDKSVLLAALGEKNIKEANETSQKLEIVKGKKIEIGLETGAQIFNCIKMISVKKLKDRMMQDMEQEEREKEDRKTNEFWHVEEVIRTLHMDKLLNPEQRNEMLIQLGIDVLRYAIKLHGGDFSDMGSVLGGTYKDNPYVFAEGKIAEIVQETILREIEEGNLVDTNPENNKNKMC